MNQLAAARAAGLPQSQWSMVERGLRAPTLVQAFAIEDLTRGVVAARDWVGFARRLRSAA